MAKKEFKFKGKSLEELQALSIKELAELLPSRQRRKIKRGFTEQEQIFLKNLADAKKPVKTHCRDMLILPNMVNKVIRIHRGNNYEDITILPEMIGNRLGEYALSRKRVQHSGAGVGGTKGKKSVSVR